MKQTYAFLLSFFGGTCFFLSSLTVAMPSTTPPTKVSFIEQCQQALLDRLAGPRSYLQKNIYENTLLAVLSNRLGVKQKLVIPTLLNGIEGTRVRIAGLQPKMTDSIRIPLKATQAVLNLAHNTLLTELKTPAEIFVVFDETKSVDSGWVLLYEIHLGLKDSSLLEEQLPVALHEYFHTLLHVNTAAASETYEAYMEEHYKIQKEKRIIRDQTFFKSEFRSQERELLRVNYFIGGLVALRNGGGESAMKKRKYIAPLQVEYSELQNPPILDFETLSMSTVNNWIEQMDEHKKSLQTKLIRTQNRLDELSQKILDRTPEEPKLTPEIASIESFYSKAIHELFADLGTILTTDDPAALSKVLKSEARDFSREFTIEEAYQHYRAHHLSVHDYFSYIRGLLWTRYFSKTPRSEWPTQFRKITEALVREILSNPPELKTLDYYNAYAFSNKHLAQLLEATLGENPEGSIGVESK